MSFDPLSAAFDLGKTAIERIWPDPVKRAEEMRKLEELRQQGDLAQLNAHVQLMLGQLEVNKAEASHKSIFVAGARPAVIWIGACGIAWQFIIYPILVWVWTTLQATGKLPADIPYPPILNSGELMALVSALLGVAGMRSFDKKNGVQTDSIRN